MAPRNSARRRHESKRGQQSLGSVVASQRLANLAVWLCVAGVLEPVSNMSNVRLGRRLVTMLQAAGLRPAETLAAAIFCTIWRCPVSAAGILLSCSRGSSMEEAIREVRLARTGGERQKSRWHGPSRWHFASLEMQLDTKTVMVACAGIAECIRGSVLDANPVAKLLSGLIHPTRTELSRNNNYILYTVLRCVACSHDLALVGDEYLASCMSVSVNSLHSVVPFQAFVRQMEVCPANMHHRCLFSPCNLSFWYCTVAQFLKGAGLWPQVPSVTSVRRMLTGGHVDALLRCRPAQARVWPTGAETAAVNDCFVPRGLPCDCWHTDAQPARKLGATLKVLPGSSRMLSSAGQH